MKNQSTQSALVIQLSQLVSRINKRNDAQLSAHGISFTEYMILKNIFDAPKRTLNRRDLAERVFLSPSGVTRLLAPLEKIGLVNKEINPRDARQSLVKLTKAGERIYNESTISFDDGTQSLLSNFSEKQLEKFRELSEKIV